MGRENVWNIVTDTVISHFAFLELHNFNIFITYIFPIM